MTGAAQGVAGLAVALGFALVGARRTGAVALLCAAQTALVAIGALAQGDAGVAVVELAEAGVLAWWGAGLRLPLALVRSAAKQTEEGGIRSRRTAALPPPRPASQPTRSCGGEIAYGSLASAALLSALAATVPGTGLALAVVLLGLLLVAAHPLPSEQTLGLRRQALGVAAMQNGLVLAAIDTGLSHGHLVLVVLPWLPALALGALWLGSDRARTGWLRAPRPAGWLDAGLCGIALLLACALPWQLGARGALWRIDALAAHAILLLTALAAAASWARRNAVPNWGSQVALLAGTVLAVASIGPLQSVFGMTLATAGAVAAALPARAEAWRRVCLGCTGLGLALFGTIALHGAPTALPATACVMLGYGALAVLAPELAVAAAILIVRMRDSTTDDLLLALGLAALLVAALGLATRDRRRRTLPLYGLAQGRRGRTLPLLGLAQGGAAVFAFGLGTDAGNLAGLLQLSFLALTQCALLLARRDGLDRLAALAGLGGVPPFGLFSSLALILAATAARAPWLLLPLGAALAAIAWAVLLQLPTQRRLLASPAWVPLGLLLIAGFAMPEPVLAWFRLAAR
jgi:hypothetical protein